MYPVLQENPAEDAEACSSGCRLPHSRSTAGFTLIEVALTSGILAVGLMVFASSLLRLNVASQAAQEEGDAAIALKQVFDTLQLLGPTNAFQSYAPNALDDPYPAPGSGTGQPFVSLALQDPVVPGLQAQASIQFFTDETQVDAQFGMPRDLDGDGLVTNLDVSALDAAGEIMADLLPVQASITWRSAQGVLMTRSWQWVISRN